MYSQNKLILVYLQITFSYFLNRDLKSREIIIVRALLIRQLVIHNQNYLEHSMT